MFKKMFCAMALVALLAVPAQAGVLSSLLSFDGNPDKLQDDSAGVVIKGAGNLGAGLEVGDIVQGVINFDQIGAPAGPVGDNSIWGVYSLEVFAGPGGPGSYFLGAVSDSTKSVAGAGGLLSQAGVSTAGLTATGAGATADALFAVFEFAGTAFTVPDDASATSGTTIMSGGKIGGQVDASWDLVLTAGFAGDDAYRIDEFAPAIGVFHGSFSVFDHGFGPGVTFLDLANGVLGNAGNVVVEFGSITPALPGGIASNNGFDFEDSGDFFVNAVPEPGSMAIFACLGLVALGRRRFA